MLNLNLHDFMVEFSEGSVQNVGPTDKQVEAKLFDVEEATMRAFGDRRVKLECVDGEGNEVQIALFPEQVESILDDAASLQDDSPVFE